MKLIGGDSGRVEQEEFVSEVLLAPSERAVVDVLLDQPGEFTLEHRTPQRSYPLASITVVEDRAEPSPQHAYEVLRRAPELQAERQRLDAYLAAPPDKILALVVTGRRQGSHKERPHHHASSPPRPQPPEILRQCDSLGPIDTPQPTKLVARIARAENLIRPGHGHFDHRDEIRCGNELSGLWRGGDPRR
jgi:hypothetical protein